MVVWHYRPKGILLLTLLFGQAICRIQIPYLQWPSPQAQGHSMSYRLSILCQIFTNLHCVWQGWVGVLPLNGLFAPTSQRKCNMNSCPAQWKHSFLITCPSHHLLRILDVIVMSWLDLGILTNGKLSVAPTPLHQWSMRRKFLSLWK